MSSSRTVSRRAFTHSFLVSVPVALAGGWRIFGMKPDAGLGPPGRCTATEPLEMGPYHREGTPWRTALSKDGERGRALTVSGSVRGEDTCAPLTDALVDVWQADASGRYDFQDDPQPTTPSNFRMRGLMLTDGGGRYFFSSVVPGNYGSSPTQQRARHIHYLIRRSGYEPLITQLYFEGDPWNARDPLVRKSLIMPVRETGAGGAAVTFDVVLRREKPVDAATLRVFEDYVGEYINQGEDVVLKIEWHAGRLVAVFGKDDVAELRPRSATSFLAAEWAAQITFVRDEQNHVVELLGDLDDGRHARLKKVR